MSYHLRVRPSFIMKRNHDGLHKAIIEPGSDIRAIAGEVNCRERLDGSPRYYHQEQPESGVVSPGEQHSSRPPCARQLFVVQDSLPESGNLPVPRRNALFSRLRILRPAARNIRASQPELLAAVFSPNGAMLQLKL